MSAAAERGLGRPRGAKARALLALLLCSSLTALIAVGCGRADNRSPGDVAVAWFEACNRGDYQQAESLSSNGLKQQLQSGFGSLFGGIEGYCDFHTRNGNLRTVEILRVHTEGERAEVELGLRFESGSDTLGGFGDGTAFRSTWPLSHEDGAWKMAPPDV